MALWPRIRFQLGSGQTVGLSLVLAGAALACSAYAESTPAENAPATPTEARLQFNFRYQPWQEVLDWFAQQADLSLVLEAPPPGTFNYRDSRLYTPAEALDVINSVLLTKGYTLVRSGRMLVLVNLEDGIPPNLVTDVPLEELDQRGEYELIRVLFPVWNMTPEAAAKEIEPLLGPQGSVVVLPNARQIQVTETGGRLRTIRKVINAVERPSQAERGIREIPLKHLSFDEVMPYLRQMLDIPEEAFATPDGSLKIGKDVTGYKLLVHGSPERVARVEDVLRLVDVPEAASGIGGAPQLEVYPISAADPQSVLQVLQTLLAGDPSVRLATDPVTGHLVAFARPAQQATIRATVDQLQRDARQVAVIPLSTVDPQVAVLAINKLFGSVDQENPDPAAPRVDADLASRSLMIRGTGGQVAQIRELLAQLGEGEDGTASARSREHVRLLPLTGSSARSALSQIEEIWPTLRSNRIRVVLPAQSVPTYRPSESSDRERDAPLRGAAPTEDTDSPDREADEPQAVAPTAEGEFHLAQYLRYVNDPEAEPRPSRPGAPIVVAPGPGGVIIASDDLEALDDFEELLTTAAGRTDSSTREFAVFYLKYSKATTVAEVLSAIFGIGPARGMGMLGEMAGGMGGGGGMGELLMAAGGAVGASSSGSQAISIVPDVRLNALVVRAKPADLDTVEQLLRVLDQRVGPEEVEADLRPRLIPVYNTSASEIAQVVQQIYQDRLAGGPTVMSPQEIFRMMRGGSAADQQAQKMSIGIDQRSNSLVVRAPDPLFAEIQALVEELDQADLSQPETTRVVSLKYTNSAAVQRALSSMLGSDAQSSTTPAQEMRPPWERRRDNNNDQNDAARQARRQFRRNMEMLRDFQRMQERMMGGNRGGGDNGRRRGGGGPPGGFPGGGGGR